MKVSIKEQRSVCVLSLEGTIMGGPDATLLNEEIHSLLDKGKKHIVVDLSAVDAMNSSGLGMLISGLTATKNAGGRLTLAAASTKILGLLAVTKLTKLFEHFPTIQAAVDSYS